MGRVMHRVRNAGVAILAAGAFAIASAASQPNSAPPPIQQSIESALASGGGIAASDIGGLRRFYAMRQNLPAWTDERGLDGDAKLAIAAIAASVDDGLDPERFEASLLASPFAANDPAARIDRDFILTADVLRYMSELRGGRSEFEHLDGDVDLPRAAYDAPAALAQAIAEHKLPQLLRALAPQWPNYAVLKAALARYRAIAANGGWQEIAAKKKFEAEDASPELLAALQTRLAREDPILAAIAAPKPGDIDAAIRRFQERTGLTVDGTVGPGTLTQLNVTPATRVAQIAANMERLRWLPHAPESVYVAVNVPDTMLAVIENGREVLTSRVIVGRPKNRTPIFRAEIDDIVANPPWIVPAKIARSEIFPKQARNPGYMARNHMTVVDGQVIQAPGPKSALGLIKLNVTDRFAVYLHDTPSRSLFARDGRFFSHGCIRVQQIQPLASYVLTGDTKAGIDQLLAAIATGDTTHIAPKAKLPVYVAYFTAFAAADGSLQFRGDVYGRDARLIAAMARTSFSQVMPPATGCGGAG